MKEKITATTITMKCKLSTTLSMMETYDFIPVMTLHDEDGNVYYQDKDVVAGGRIKVPFYGTNGVIVSSRYNDKSRGVRKGGGQLHNVVAIDLQLHNKNYNLKISRNNIQLTGAPSEEYGIEAFRFTCEILMSVREMMEEVKLLSEEEREEILSHALANHYSLNLKLNDLSPKLEKYYNFITDYIDDNTSEQFEEKIRRMYRFPQISSEIVEPYAFTVVNAVFMHRFTYSRVPVIKLLVKLSEYYQSLKKENPHSIKVFQQNQFSKQLIVTVPCTSVENKIHKFIVYGTGTVRQNSPTNYDESIHVYTEVGKVIERFMLEVIPK